MHNPQIKHIEILNQNFELHPCGAVLWKEKQMLLIADVHFGKISHFRKHGSAVPLSAIKKNFKQLDLVIHHFRPEKICFLGDLFHSHINAEWKLFEKWTQGLSAQLILIAGNHDIISPLKYEDLSIQVGSELVIESFLFSHHPEERDELFNFCGHVHPGIHLQGLGRQTLKLPCFFQSKNQMILPAFGEFTGLYILEPEEQDKVYALAENEVIQVA